MNLQPYSFPFVGEITDWNLGNPLNLIVDISGMTQTLCNTALSVENLLLKEPNIHADFALPGKETTTKLEHVGSGVGGEDGPDCSSLWVTLEI